MFGHGAYRVRGIASRPERQVSYCPVPARDRQERDRGRRRVRAATARACRSTRSSRRSCARASSAASRPDWRRTSSPRRWPIGASPLEHPCGHRRGQLVDDARDSGGARARSAQGPGRRSSCRRNQPQTHSARGRRRLALWPWWITWRDRMDAGLVDPPDAGRPRTRRAISRWRSCTGAVAGQPMPASRRRGGARRRPTRRRSSRRRGP